MSEKEIWVAVGKSESGDDYCWGWWDHKPTKAEVKKGFDFDEEWPYVYYELHSMTQL
jgi:hypothetical protein